MEEAHPIPQNVTSFEFHLVGDMTLKQFGYIGGGGALGYVTFAVLSGLGVPILGGLLGLLFLIIGAAYAFAPILDRPLDHWTKAFFKAVYSPTRGNWKSPKDPKVKINPEDPIFKDRLKTYLTDLRTTPTNSVNPEEKNLEPTSDKELDIKLTQDLSTKPLTVIAQESKKMTDPIKMRLTKDEPMKSSADNIINPQPPALKPLKITPENNLSSQTLQSVKQEVENQNKTSTILPPHQNFTPTNFPAFVDNQTDSQLDFSPQNNSAYQHLQFVYEAPILKQGTNNAQNSNTPLYNHPAASANIVPQPNIQFNQPTSNLLPPPNVNSLFTSISLPNQIPQPSPLKINQVNYPSIPTPQAPPQTTPVKEDFPLHPVLQTSSNPAVNQPPVKNPESNTSSNLPSSEELNKLVELAKEARTLQVKLAEAEKRIKDITVNATNADVTKPISGDKFDQVYSKLQNLITQTDSLNKEAAEVHKVIPPASRPSTVKVKVVEPIKTQTTQPILTSQPNVINGIVTDSAGNYLEGVIIIIHDKDNLPVRALKTNKIGQFTGTTPLPGGIYTITLEKEHLNFDTLEVNLNGEIIPALQVSAKAGGAITHA